MKTAREISLLAIVTALLIGAQFIFSFVAGVEIVTVTFCAFCIVFGAKDGIIVGIAFSLIRCMIWGFFPNIVILYLIYYSAFALFFGLLGKSKLNKYFIVLFFAVLFTCCFTLLDDIISPIMYGVKMKPYFIASLPIMTMQVVNVLITVAALINPLKKVFKIAYGFLRIK